jgi:hypothetical protein
VRYKQLWVCLDSFGMTNGKSVGGKSFDVTKILVGV